MATTPMHTDCQLLDALEQRQAPADPRSLAARLTQLCEEQALPATPEQIAQAAADVATQQTCVAPTAAFAAWKRPSTPEEWAAIERDQAWVKAMWEGTLRRMQAGVIATVGLTAVGLLVLRLGLHVPLIRQGGALDELVLGLFITALLGGVGALVQAGVQGAIGVILEYARLRKWSRRFGLPYDTARYTLRRFDANPKALARWKASPTARRHLKNILAQPVPLLALDAQRLTDMVEWEGYEAAETERQAQWRQGLQEVAVET